MEKKNILIADSGSTKTDWLYVNDGRTVQFQSAGMNPFYQNKDQVAAVLQSEVIPRLPGDVENIFFYGAGCANALASKPISDALVELIPTAASQIEVASDMLGAARGLCIKETGLACILGTGANNAFYDGVNIVRSIGSLGFWLGDEGSGSYLGKTIVVYFLQNEMPEDLQILFARTYPEIDRLSVLEHAYKKPFPNRYFATFSKFIGENVGHVFVQKMVTDAFDLFVKKYILKHRQAEKYPVHFTGSIAFYYQEILRGSLSRHGLQAGKILKSPLKGLAEYHSG